LPTCPPPPGRTIRRWDFILSDSIRRRSNSCLGCNIVAVHGNDANCDSSCRPVGSSNRCSGGTIGQQRSTGQSAGAWNRLCSVEFFRAADKNLSRWRIQSGNAKREDRQTAADSLAAPKASQDRAPKSERTPSGCAHVRWQTNPVLLVSIFRLQRCQALSLL
jgi:hypothetical protein